MAFAAQHDVAGAGHRDGELVGVPARGGFSRHHAAVGLGEVTIEEAKFCGAFNFAIGTGKHSHTFRSVAGSTCVTININGEKVAIARGKRHQRQAQFGHGAVGHVGQLQLMGTIVAESGSIYLKDLGSIA